MEYLFYTDEGYCEAPDGTSFENLQILGIEEGVNFNDAYKKLMINNQWITRRYNCSSITCKMILPNSIYDDILHLLDYINANSEDRKNTTNKRNNEIISSLTKRIKSYLSRQ